MVPLTSSKVWVSTPLQLILLDCSMGINLHHADFCGTMTRIDQASGPQVLPYCNIVDHAYLGTDFVDSGILPTLGAGATDYGAARTASIILKYEGLRLATLSGFFGGRNLSACSIGKLQISLVCQSAFLHRRNRRQAARIAAHNRPPSNFFQNMLITSYSSAHCPEPKALLSIYNSLIKKA